MDLKPIEIIVKKNLGYSGLINLLILICTIYFLFVSFRDKIFDNYFLSNLYYGGMHLFLRLSFAFLCFYILIKILEFIYFFMGNKILNINPTIFLYISSIFIIILYAGNIIFKPISPHFGTPMQIEGAIWLSEQNIDDLVEISPNEEIGKTYEYTLNLDKSEPLLWGKSWCATTPEILENNLDHLKYEFKIEGYPIPVNHELEMDFVSDYRQDKYCRGFVVLLYDWPSGIYHLERRQVLSEKIFDGLNDYEPGYLTDLYVITIK
jgi:hypothetical protein